MRVAANVLPSRLPRDPTPDTRSIGLDGGRNLALLAAVVALVLMSGLWKPGIEFDVYGTAVGLPGLLRDAGLVAVTLVLLLVTPKKVHQDNQFSWAPMQEVAKLFAGIFRRAARHRDAELFRLHGLVRCRADSAFRRDVTDLVPLVHFLSLEA